MASSIEDNVAALKVENPKPLYKNGIGGTTVELTDEEYEAKILEWATNKNTNDLDAEANSYKWDREAEYPEIKEQLDKLYHDIDGGLLGEDAKTGSWYLAIKEVKDNNPKPSE